MSVRFLALYAFRAVGGFALAQLLTRKQLRILCYHGFAVGDEYKVARGMFMRGETFERRMAILKRRRIPVISLNAAVPKLVAGQVKGAETVITFDDGWATNLSVGLPILEKYGYPASVYITTEHLAAGTEVFNVVLSYLIRSSGRTSLRLEGLHPQIDGTYEIQNDPDGAIVSLIVAAEHSFPLADRQRLLRPIAQALGLDLDSVLSDKRFRLLSSDEIRELSHRGMDVQLHSHTHRLPEDRDGTTLEIQENQEAIRSLTGETARHFCYPSGKYSAQHPQWLASLGIISATTCDTGLNDVRTSPLLLKRFLDSESFSDIAFEAEICGIRDVARRIRGVLRGRKPSHHRPLGA